jgi:hypothetical protein
MKRPADTEFAADYGTYVSLVPETEVISVLENQPAEVAAFASMVEPGREQFRYGPGKWSVREVLGHVVDSERLFGHRAFCIGHGEQQPLPGFDQDAYMAASTFDDQPLYALVSEFAQVREVNLIMFRRFRDADWDRIGIANGKPVSVRALAFMMAGHVRHHLRILEEKYR